MGSRPASRACFANASYQALARLPQGLVIADVNLGPYVLALTPHSVVGAPYHRISTGIIVSQAPTGSGARGSRVRISVSEGPSPGAPTSVPSVVGQDQASASQAVNQAGFKPVVLFRRTSDQSKVGVVVDEQPAAGASIPAGSYVAIFVGRA